jgi:predicted HicB family RNase H-like nuclease
MHIQTRLDPQVLEAAKRAAELEGTSLSEYLRKLVQRDLEFRNDGKAGEGESDRIR